jgi:hypothetical protein
VASESYNLSWVNCEMASFIHMKASSKFYQSPQDEVSAVRRSVHTALVLRAVTQNLCRGAGLSRIFFACV